MIRAMRRGAYFNFLPLLASVLFFVRPAPAAEFAVVDRFSVQNAAIFKTSATIGRSDLAGAALLVSTNTTATPALFIDKTSGNVGIGMSNPAMSLDIGSGQLRVPNGTAAAPAFTFPDTTEGMFRDAGTGFLGLATSGAPRLIITSAGSVGIGTTNPGQRLDVQGGSINVQYGVIATTYSFTTLTADPASASRGMLYFNTAAQAGAGALMISLNGTSFVPISTGTSSGGISTVSHDAQQFTGDGNATPLTLLSSSVTLQGNSFNAANLLVKLDSAGSITVPANGTVQGNNFSVGSSTFVVAGGKVGIGTTNPQAALDVSGPLAGLQFDTSSGGQIVVKSGNSVLFRLKP